MFDGQLASVAAATTALGGPPLQVGGKLANYVEGGRGGGKVRQEERRTAEGGGIAVLDRPDRAPEGQRGSQPMGGLLGVEETTAAASSGEFKKQNESDFYSRRILSPI